MLGGGYCKKFSTTFCMDHYFVSVNNQLSHTPIRRMKSHTQCMVRELQVNKMQTGPVTTVQLLWTVRVSSITLTAVATNYIIYLEHRRKLANNTGGRGSKIDMGMRNFNLWRSQIRKGEDWLEPILTIHTPLSPTLNPIFCVCPSTQ